jgi:hypothetical protein
VDVLETHFSPKHQRQLSDWGTADWFEDDEDEETEQREQ